MTRLRATIYWLSSIGPVLLGIACDRGTGSDRRFVKQQYVNTDIVFNSNRDQGRVDIYVMDRNGGSLRQLTKNSRNNWGPQWNWRDKTKIIFASDRDGDALELYLMDADGKNQRRLTFTEGIEETWPSISPDGRYALFPRGLVNGRKCSPFCGPHDIWKKDLVTGEDVNLTSSPDADDLEVWFNAGATKIVYTSDRDSLSPGNGVYDVFVMETDGSHKVNLTKTPDVAEDHAIFNHRGDKISFARGTRPASTGNRDWDIWIMNNDGTNARRVAGDPTQNDCPPWSPDDTELVFETNVDAHVGKAGGHGPGQGDLVRFTFATGATKNLTNTPTGSWSLHPSW